MKKIFSMLLFFAVLVFLPVKSHALVDAEVFGGYVFNAEFDGLANGTVKDGKGPDFGIRGHFNKDVALFDLGLGLYWQKTNLDFSISGADFENKITSFGFDAYVKLDLPAIPVNPYLRAGLGIRDRFQVDGVSSSVDDTENFNSYYYGIGAAFTVLPLPAIDVQVFGEYIYSSYKNEENSIVDMKTNAHAFNIGALVSI